MLYNKKAAPFLGDPSVSHWMRLVGQLRPWLLVLLLVFCENWVVAGNIRVLKSGLGNGRVVIRSGAVNALDCGGDCNGTYSDNTDVTIEAIPDDESTFLGWLGDVRGGPTETVLSFNRNGNLSLRPVFGVIGWSPATVAADRLTEAQLNPRDIADFLRANPEVNSPARFIAALPVKYRQNWIMMTRSESLQTGTASSPRILLPGPDAKNTFSVGMRIDASHPASAPRAIEYMQFDERQLNFRFHEIILGNIDPIGVLGSRPREDPVTMQTVLVEVDDPKCFQCHSTRNVYNRSPFTGTTGVRNGYPVRDSVQHKSKPNWDTYDSWAGMLPFNRDRIYEGSLEEVAYKAIFNLWNWRGSATNDAIRQVLEQLWIQSPNVSLASVHSIVRDTSDTTNERHIRMGYEGRPALGRVNLRTNFAFGGPAEDATDVPQGGRYVTLRHTEFSTGGLLNENYLSPLDDEGRGVVFFDLLGGNKGRLNQKRVVSEIANQKYVTGSHYRDMRPVALAIANGLIRISTPDSLPEFSIGGARLVHDEAWYVARNGMNLRMLARDTRDRMRALPRRKAELQKTNVDRTFPDGLDAGEAFERDPYLGRGEPQEGLKQRYGEAGEMSTVAARNEILRRPVEPLVGIGAVSVNGGAYIDREIYSQNLEKVTLFRYFLEPMGLSVDKWNMGVRGRSRTYTFADIFASYLDELQTGLRDSLTSMYSWGTRLPVGFTNSDLATAVNASLAHGIDAIEPPKYTDVQRIFNKACIECHGGLGYPPYFGAGTSGLNLSENEGATGTPGDLDPTDDRLWNSYRAANSYSTAILNRISAANEATPYMMPYGGPALSRADVLTISRWLDQAIDPATRRRPYAVGDPHLQTVNGVSYDFQGAGEYVLLRGDYVEIQSRMRAVNAAPVGPDGHTGLRTCVSLNNAIALSLLGHRITYQPNMNGEPDPSGMQLRVDGKLVALSELPLPFAPSARIVRSSAEHGLQIEGPGGLAIVLTPRFWDHYRLWYIDLNIKSLRASEGLMGFVHPNQWLPALPDGTQLGEPPKDAGARYKLLYGVFAQAWQVTDSTSLFDYAPGMGPRDYSFPTWPGGNDPQGCTPPAYPNAPTVTPLPPLGRAEAESACANIQDPERRALCIMDVMATGDRVFAESYLAVDRIMQNHDPKPPKLIFPASYQTGVQLPLTLQWESGGDDDGDALSYRVLVWPISELPNNNEAVEVGGSAGDVLWGFRKSCLLWVVGILLVVLVLLYLLLRKKPKVFWLLALLAVALAGMVLLLCCRGSASPTTYVVESLSEGKSYNWRVIAEDGNGGLTESDIGRFELE